ncbi:Ninjurin-1 [Bulinus truncatus]|nr:Ninjurin-1 [Bulinus truncatus]
MSHEKPEVNSLRRAAGCEDHVTESDMRNSSVHPVFSEVNGDGPRNEGRLPDDADGADPLTSESFAPLLSTNQFLVRKMAAQALMDVALMMANISQLRTLVYAGPGHMEYYYPLLILVSLSLAAQLIFAVLIFVIWVRESDQHQRQEYLRMAEVKANANPEERARLSTLNRDEEFRAQRLTNHLNYITMVLVFAITVVNMFITGFGIKLDSTEVLKSTATTH